MAGDHHWGQSHHLRNRSRDRLALAGDGYSRQRDHLEARRLRDLGVHDELQGIESAASLHTK